jgi:hypothetical protein
VVCCHDGSSYGACGPRRRNSSACSIRRTSQIGRPDARAFAGT